MKEARKKVPYSMIPCIYSIHKSKSIDSDYRLVVGRGWGVEAMGNDCVMAVGFLDRPDGGSCELYTLKQLILYKVYLNFF